MKSKKKKLKITIKPEDVKVRNEFHFDIQRKYKMNIFKDKTKYTRKKKHKNKED